jgi:hypothetical protein
MPHHIVREVLAQAPQDSSSPALRSRHMRGGPLVRAAWCLLRHWWPTLNHQPPEMHAIDHLARDHPRAFV